MQTTPRASEKPTDLNRIDDRDTTAAQPHATRDVALIDEATIRSLEDEHTDAEGCRFAAVARSLEQTRHPETGVRLPVTIVAYVDAAGEYAIEREFFGYREDWADIPRTVVVTDPSAVSKLPDAHAERYAPILETYHDILGGA